MASQEDPKVAAGRLRAAQLAKAGPGSSPQQIGQFIKDTLTELKKTTWPDRFTLTRSTIVVLSFIVATMIWVGALDFILTRVTVPLFGK